MVNYYLHEKSTPSNHVLYIKIQLKNIIQRVLKSYYRVSPITFYAIVSHIEKRVVSHDI